MRAEYWQELFCDSLGIRNYSEATVYSYGLEVRSFCRFVAERGVRSPSELGREEVMAYQLHLHHFRKPCGEPLSPGTRCNKLKAVLSFLRYLREAGFVLGRLDEHIKLPKVPEGLPWELPDEEQVMRLLNAPTSHSNRCLRGPTRRLQDRGILELLYSCALRNTELRSLRLGDVDLHRLVLEVKTGKGGKARRLPMTESAASWVESYLLKERPLLETEESGDILFLNNRGRRFRKDTLSRLVRRYAEAAGLPMKVTPHTLRHACATHMLGRKAGLRHLQTFLGHANADSTQVYTKVDVSDLREVLMRCHPRESF